MNKTDALKQILGKQFSKDYGKDSFRFTHIEFTLNGNIYIEGIHLYPEDDNGVELSIAVYIWEGNLHLCYEIYRSIDHIGYYLSDDLLTCKDWKEVFYYAKLLWTVCEQAHELESVGFFGREN